MSEAADSTDEGVRRSQIVDVSAMLLSDLVASDDTTPAAIHAPVPHRGRTVGRVDIRLGELRRLTVAPNG